jgi:putative component of membrane protein insertase Oxa1/YidC/SpoIIIJ protein YidD
MTKTFLILIILIGVSFWVKSQDVIFDLKIIESNIQHIEQKNSYYRGKYNTQDVMKNTNKHSSYNPFFFIGKAAMYSYQNMISAQLSKECPYEITCSNYCKLSIEKKGLFIGVFMGVERLLRCNKLSMIDVLPTQISSETEKVIEPINVIK